MARYAVLEHHSPRGLHWDFMLEMGAALMTWALRQPPESSEPVVAEALADHRLQYLEYEGPISGGRGSVRRWDRGTYELESRSDSEVVVTLSGQRLSGRVLLARMAGESGQWEFSYLAAGRHSVDPER